MAWKTKVTRDANHPGIVKDLTTKYDKKVVDLAAVGHGVPDIIAADDFCTVLVEIKMPTGRFYLTQLEFLADWPGRAGFAETTEDVLRLMHDPDAALNAFERIAIKAIVDQLRSESKSINERMPRVAVRKFEKLFRAAGGRI